MSDKGNDPITIAVGVVIGGVVGWAARALFGRRKKRMCKTCKREVKDYCVGCSGHKLYVKSPAKKTTKKKAAKKKAAKKKT